MVYAHSCGRVDGVVCMVNGKMLVCLCVPSMLYAAQRYDIVVVS